MIKDLWEHMNRLQGLAIRATPGPWHKQEDDAAFIAAANPAMILEMIAKMRNFQKELNDTKAQVGRKVKRIGILEADLERLRKAYRKLEDENSKLKTVSDFVAKKGLQLAKQLAEFCNPDHNDQCCSLYSENCNNANFIEWREAAHDAVKEGE